MLPSPPTSLRGSRLSLPPWPFSQNTTTSQATNLLFSRQATRAAKDQLPSTDYKRAMNKHDMANLAKHRWSETVDMETGFLDPVPSPPLCCAESPPVCVPAVAVMSTQTDEFFFHSDASEFIPSQPLESCAVADPCSSSSWSSLMFFSPISPSLANVSNS